MNRAMPTVTINRTDCTSCSACWSTGPDVFEEDPDDGLCRIVEKFRKGGNKATGEIPEQHSACAQDAADGCPVSIITMSG
jgi:ferredoxin